MLTTMLLICLTMTTAINNAHYSLEDMKDWRKPKVIEVKQIDSLTRSSQMECLSILQNGQKLIKLWIEDKAYKYWEEYYGIPDYGRPEVDEAFCITGQCLALHCYLFWKLEEWRKKNL